MITYIEYNFKVEPIFGSEILIAELSEQNFESFVETENGVLAYIQKEFAESVNLDDVFILKNEDFKISFEVKEIEPVNWNEEWEKNFSPIIVDEICCVRATFHPKTSLDYEIIINPKMSFGTGHHQTTHLMLSFLLKMNLEGKKVLDMGCGTGILAIMAHKRGAKSVMAVDIDPWCEENSKENFALNNIDNIELCLGDASAIKNKNFDVILANINRNILLSDLIFYAETLNPNAEVLLSGFYKEDLPLIEQKCNEFGLKLETFLEKDYWIAAKFSK